LVSRRTWSRRSGWDQAAQDHQTGHQHQVRAVRAAAPAQRGFQQRQVAQQQHQPADPGRREGARPPGHARQQQQHQGKRDGSGRHGRPSPKEVARQQHGLDAGKDPHRDPRQGGPGVIVGPGLGARVRRLRAIKMAGFVQLGHQRLHGAHGSVRGAGAVEPGLQVLQQRPQILE
jgi:hypothetical protein